MTNLGNTTMHSRKRAKERTSLSKRSISRDFNTAFEKGIRKESLPAQERNFLNKRCNSQKEAVYYNGLCYIFSIDGICITLFPVPVWFLKKTKFSGKVRVRNPKKYFLKYTYENLACA